MHSRLVHKDQKKIMKWQNPNKSRGMPILALRSLTRSLQSTGKRGSAMAHTHRHTNTHNWRSSQLRDWIGTVGRCSENAMQNEIYLTVRNMLGCVKYVMHCEISSTLQTFLFLVKWKMLFRIINEMQCSRKWAVMFEMCISVGNIQCSGKFVMRW